MKRIIIIIIVAVVLVASLVVALLILGNRTTGSTISIGGFRVSVLGVMTHGKPFTTEKKWHPWARKLLPGRFKQWIPSPQAGSMGGSSNGSVSVFIQLMPNHGTSVPTLPWAGYRSESLAGEVFEVTDQVEYPSSGVARTDRMLIVELNSFPRRDQAFNLKLLAKDGTEVGALRVPNPTPGPFPAWAPRPLPQTVTNEGVALTLKSLANLPNKRPRRLQDGPNRAIWLSPAYELKSFDPKWAKAKVVSTTADDATGNEHAPLPRTEPSWRIRTVVRRFDPAAFLPEEKLVLTSLAPTNAVVAGVALRIPVPGRSQTFQDESTGSPSVFTGRFEELIESTFWIETDADLDEGGVQILSVAYDKSGKDLGLPTPPGFVEKAGMMRRVRFTLPNWPSGPKEWSRVEILVSRPKVFEFFVNPADVKTSTTAR